MKIIKPMFMLCSMIFAALPLAADTWTDPETSITWTYTVLDDGTVSLGSGVWNAPAIDQATTGELDIPGTVNEKTVTAIGMYAFYGCSGLTSVTIPDGVTSIGNGAFSSCSRLTSVAIPEGVTSIGASAFAWCYNLRSLEIPASVAEIGLGAFAGCNNLTLSVNAENASYKMEDGFLLTKDGTLLVRGPANISSADIPATVTSIGDYAFYNCGNLRSVTIPEGVTSINSAAFYYCYNLASVTIPERVTSIGDLAFASCSSLSTVDFAGDREAIEINLSAFDRTPWVQSPEGFPLTLAQNSWYDGETYVKTVLGYHGRMPACLGLEELADVTAIGSYAFDGCAYLEELVVPVTVTSIGYEAFARCSNLKLAYLPASLEDVIDEAIVFGQSPVTIYYYEGDEPIFTTVTLVPNGGTLTATTLRRLKGAGLGELPEPVKSDEFFTGWFTAADESGEPVTQKTLATEGLTLYAHWQATDFTLGGRWRIDEDKRYVSVTTNAEGTCWLEKTVTGPCVVSFDWDFACNEAPGYTYWNAQWYFTIDGSSKGIWAYLSKSGTSDYSSGTTGAQQVFIAEAGEHTIRWTYRPYSGENVRGVLSAIEINEDVEVYAITLDANGGRIWSNSDDAYLESLDVVVRSSLDILNEPEYYGKAFIGWFTAPDESGEAWDEEKPMHDGLVFYAHWEDIEPEWSYEVVDGGIVLSSCYPVIGELTVPDTFEVYDGAGGTVSLPVVAVSDWGFEECYKMTAISLPSTVTNIGERAFATCPSLEKVTFRGGETQQVTIDDTAFLGTPYDATRPFSWVIDEREYWNYDTGDWTMGSVLVGFHGTCPAEVTLPTGYDSCYDITPFDFPSAANLEVLTVPQGTTVLRNPFKYCKNLTTVNLPEGLETILDWSFWGCDGLTEITLPSTITDVTTNAFNGIDGTITVYADVSLQGALQSATFTDYRDWEWCGQDGWDWSAEEYTTVLNVVFNDPANPGGGDEPGGDEPDEPEVEFEYEVNEDGETITLIGVVGEVPAELVIPEVYAEYAVTSLGEGMFSNCTVMTSIAIPSSVTSIGANAFFGCNNLASLYIEDLGAWCDMVFGDGSASSDNFMANPLRGGSETGVDLYVDGEIVCDLVIPEGVVSVATGAFMRGTFDSIEFPTTLTAIGDYAFYDCGNIDQIDLNSNLSSIGAFSFAGCANASSVSIPASLQSIGSFAFHRCEQLEDVNVESLDSWFSIRFANSWSNPMELASTLCLDGTPIEDDIQVPAGITDIGFAQCAYLQWVKRWDIPEGVERIGSHAFYECSSLEEVTLPATLSEISGICVFADCDNLTNLVFSGNAPTVGDGVFNGVSPNCVVTVPRDSTGWGEVPGTWHGLQIRYAEAGEPGGGDEPGDEPEPPEVKTWEDNTTGLTWTYTVLDDGTVSLGGGWNAPAINQATAGALDIPGTVDGKAVTVIGDHAFSGCSSLTSVTIPVGVTSIGREAFSCCSALVSVTIPESVTHVGDETFYVCTSLKRVTIPAGITRIAVEMFSYCSALESVTMLGNVTDIGVSAFSNCENLTSVNIPDSVTHIGRSAFSNCNASLYDTDTIPGVQLVSGWAIGTTSELPGELDLTLCRGIGDYAFEDCTDLTSVTIPDTVTSIGEGAFMGCRGLADEKGFVIVRGCLYGYYGESGDIMIPVGVTSIGAWAFQNCTDLTSVTIPEGVTTIGEGAFCACSSLTSVTIPAGVTSIGGYAFEDCTDLTSVTIPASVTSLGDWAFSYCSDLKTATIGAAVTSLGEGAFYECESLEEIVFLGNAPILGEDVFEYVSDDCVVTVPQGSTGWNVPIPGEWQGLSIRYAEAGEPGGDEPDPEPEPEPEPEPAPVVPAPEPEPEPEPAPVVEDPLVALQPAFVPPPDVHVETTEEAPVETAAVEYTGYLKDASGQLSGTVQLKLAKAGKDGTSKVSGTVVIGTKKAKVTGTYKDGVLTAAGFSDIALDKNGITGKYGAYTIDGTRNVFAAKDATSKASSDAAMKAYKGSYTVAWKENGLYGGVTVTVGNKGKTKASGFLPDGTKVGASGQLMLGDGSACITLVSTNKKAPLGFNLWLQGGSAVVEGLGDIAAASKVVALGGGKSFTCSLLGTKVPVTLEGKKWTVKTDKATALKLTFTPKTGAFKGSFKVGKQKVSVNGVVVNGLGFGSAVIKKGDKAGVTIE